MAAIQLNNIQYRGDNPEVAGMYENRAYKTDADLENANHRKNAAQYASKYKDTNVHDDELSTKEVDGGNSGNYSFDAQADDDDGKANAFLKFTRTVQNATSSSWKKHKKLILYIFVGVLLCLYLAYFGLAMNHERLVGEPSIRLCWVTCVVVFFILLDVLSYYCGDRMKECCRPCTSKLARHETLISWILIAALFLALIVFVFVDVFVNTKQHYNLVSGAGLLVYVLVFFIFSTSPAHVQWRAVAWGLGLQLLFAVLILRWDGGYSAFKWLGERVAEFLQFSDIGAAFLFGDNFREHYFAFKILPTIIFFSTVISILYYVGVMQVIVKYVAAVMQFAMGTTAGESLNAAGNIFVGQTEAPLMIRPMLPHMTRSELHAVMTGGFATVAGGVLAAYISFGVPANHLLSASVMSAPAALAMSKLFYPETEKSKTTVKQMRNIPKSDEVNLISAASNGASQSIALVANVAVNLIAFIALLAFVDATLSWFGHRVGLDDPPLTFRLICSYVLFPLAFFMGVDPYDCRRVAELIGIKTFLNEFIAYDDLGKLIHNREDFDSHIAQNGTWFWDKDNIMLDPLPGFNETATLTNGFLSIRSEVISTYALCGFANIGSIGIQLGGLGAMAPERRNDLARVAVRAMIAGNVACFMTACIAGLFFQG